jgi:hypothetical protein
MARHMQRAGKRILGQMALNLARCSRTMYGSAGATISALPERTTHPVNQRRHRRTRRGRR